mgnify:CR=1 FL=1
MPSCEKCWGDAYMRTYENPYKSQAEHYQDLLDERKDKPCTPKQKAGQFWDDDLQRDSRIESEAE